MGKPQLKQVHLRGPSRFGYQVGERRLIQHIKESIEGFAKNFFEPASRR
jgi:hypothetical protein